MSIFAFIFFIVLNSCEEKFENSIDYQGNEI